MIKVLFTGGTGFVGRNVIPLLRRNYDIVAPTRQELDLKDQEMVERYVREGNFDVVIHSANSNPVKNVVCDTQEHMLEDSLRAFMNLYRVRKNYGKLVYLGSGAEYDKTLEISKICETDAARSLPHDVYGFAKYIMNELAARSENVYNMRLFACYGPFDHESKFITHCIRCCLEGREITIRQNCVFDYIHVYDLAKVLSYAVGNNLRYHDYNIASGERYTLQEIAEKVKNQMKSNQSIVILKEGWNREYTPDITRLRDEMNLADQFLSLDEGIAMQIEHERKYWG